MLKEEAIKPGKNYVDNAKLYQCFLDWYKARDEAEKEGRPEPEPPRYISECIVLIPTRLASKRNFSGYTFRDEMIGDAIENIIKYYRNFDPNKSKNPFSYFTQFAYYAFIRRILKERNESYAKHKMIQNSDLLETISTQEHDEGREFQLQFVEMMKMNLNPDLEKFYEVKKKKKVKKIKIGKSIENLFGDSQDA